VFGFVILVVVLVVLAVIAERSLRRQRGSMLQRSREESQAMSHATWMQAHRGGGGGL
jgi:hypothetical protein